MLHSLGYTLLYDYHLRYFLQPCLWQDRSQLYRSSGFVLQLSQLGLATGQMEHCQKSWEVTSMLQHMD